MSANRNNPSQPAPQVSRAVGLPSDPLERRLYELFGFNDGTPEHEHTELVRNIAYLVRRSAVLENMPIPQLGSLSFIEFCTEARDRGVLALVVHYPSRTKSVLHVKYDLDGRCMDEVIEKVDWMVRKAFGEDAKA